MSMSTFLKKVQAARVVAAPRVADASGGKRANPEHTAADAAEGCRPGAGMLSKVNQD